MTLAVAMNAQSFIHCPLRCVLIRLKTSIAKYQISYVRQIFQRFTVQWHTESLEYSTFLYLNYSETWSSWRLSRHSSLEYYTTRWISKIGQNIVTSVELIIALHILMSELKTIENLIGGISLQIIGDRCSWLPYFRMCAFIFKTTDVLLIAPKMVLDFKLVYVMSSFF